MRKLLGHILALVLLLASLDVCNGQNVVRSTMDGDIERYEMLCELCLNLKTRIRQGEDISKNEAQTFINRFLSMNKDLKDKEHEMTALQRRKFSAISLWFSTGQKLEVAEQIRELAVKAYVAMDCKGLSRVDFFVKRADNSIVFNEINTLPGFTSISMYPKLFAASGIPYSELIDALLNLAVEAK